MKQKLTLLLFALLCTLGTWAQLTSISDGTLTTWAFQRVDNGASGWIDGDFKNNGATDKTAAVFKFEYAGASNTYYIIDVATGNYVYASSTTKSGSSTDSRLAKGSSSLPASEDDSKPQVNNLKAYKWVLHYNESVAGKSYGSMVWDIAPSQNTSLRLALWSQTADPSNNIILFDSGYNIAYFKFYQPSVGALINANLTFGQIKAQGYTGDDIAEYYKPEYLDVVGWPTTAAYNTFKTAINALDDEDVVSTAYATPYATMCTTVKVPEVGKFYTIFQPVAGKYIHAVTPDYSTNLAASTDGTASSAIFYVPYSGRFLSYKYGFAMVGNKIYNGTYASGGYQTYTIDHYSGHPLGTLRINGGNYLAADAGNDYVWTSSYGAETSKYWQFTEATSLPITMNASGGAYYATINLPVAVEIPSGLSAYSATALGDVMTLTKVVEGGVLAANKPVILYSESSVTSLTISNETGSSPAGTNELLGTTAALTVTANENYVLGTGSAGVGFYKYNNTVMPGFKAYLPASATASAKAYTFSFEDVEDAIRAIESENSGLEIYDISGRRVQKAQKGLYIVNGKKVMFK
jgi:hypothetical protein